MSQIESVIKMLDEKAIQDPAFATDDSDLSHDDGDSSIFGDAGSDQGSKAAVPCEFLCGVAGSGKTFELKRRIEADPSYGLLMATTGVAAVNLGTVTIHSTLGYFKTEHMAENYSTGRLQARIRRIIQEKGVRNFCVDEISMMPAEQLDYLHQAISEVNGYKTTRTPIGIVACGDFCQLSPIKAKWAFEAECWPDFQKNVKKLTKIWRQSDDSFLRVLNFLRIGDGKSACELIQGITKFAWNRDDNYDGTTCLTTNDEVERHNFRMLMQTQGKPIVTESRRWGQVSGDWRLIPEKLGLKVGCLVMILANDSPKFSYANGDTGHVESFDGRYFTIKLVRNGQLVRIGRIYRTHQVKEPPIGVDPESCPRIGEGDEIPFGEVSYDSERKAFHVGGIEYFPIRVAYGATVHKLQGVSLDRIQFDFRHRFAGNPASMYVAISRCRTPQGLRLIGSEKQFIERVKVDPKVIPWL